MSKPVCCCAANQGLLQGWGQLANLGVLMVGLLAFNSKGAGPYSHGAAGATYRFSFAFIAVFIAWLAYFRIWRMKGADSHLHASKQKRKVLCPTPPCPAALMLVDCVHASIVPITPALVLCKQPLFEHLDCICQHPPCRHHSSATSACKAKQPVCTSPQAGYDGTAVYLY